MDYDRNEAAVWLISITIVILAILAMWTLVNQLAITPDAKPTPTASIPVIVYCDDIGQCSE